MITLFLLRNLSLLWCILIALGVIGIAASLGCLFNGGKSIIYFDDAKILGRETKKLKFRGFKYAEAETWLRAVILGLLTGATGYFNCLTVQHGWATWLGFIYLAIMLGVFIYTLYWWVKEGSEFKELVWFVALGALYTLVLCDTVRICAVVVAGAEWARLLFLVLPWIIATLYVGSLIINTLCFHKEEIEQIPEEQLEEKDHKNYKFLNWGSIVTHVVAIAIVLALIIFAVIVPAVKAGPSNAAAAEEPPAATEDPNASQTITIWYKSYNLSLQGDGDASNDLNFGYSYYAEGRTALEYFQNLSERTEVDVPLAVAVAAWTDHNTGSRLLGDWYTLGENSKIDWAITMNKASAYFMDNQPSYNVFRNNLLTFLQTASMEVTSHDTKTVKNMMYMNPYIKDSHGMPTLAVYETDNAGTHYLAFTWNIEGKLVSFMELCIDCGYQPANCEKMGITVQRKPTDTPKDNKPSDDKPTVTPKPTNPPSDKPTTPSNPPSDNITPTPSNPPSEHTPTPSNDPYDKDVKAGAPVGTNDTPGIENDPNTNNGVNAQTSAADTAKDNSSHLTDQEYKDEEKNLADANNARNGGEPNTPSTPASAGANVDNPGATGNNIDKPTVPTTPETAGGQPIEGSGKDASNDDSFDPSSLDGN